MIKGYCTIVYIVHSLNYCCVEYYYAYATHALRMSYEVFMIVVRKNYITLQLRYDTIGYLFLTGTVFNSEKNCLIARLTMWLYIMNR